MFLRVLLLCLVFIPSTLASASDATVPPDSRLLASPTSASDTLDRLRNLGKAYYEEDRFEEAIQVLEQVVERSPQTARDHVNLGIAYIAQKRYDEAIEQFEQARDLDPSLPHIDYNLGIIAKRQGRFEDAARHLEAVVELDPVDPDARYNLGLVYLRLKQREKAVEQFQKCVQFDPENASAYYHLMRDALRQGDRERADELLKIYEYLRDNSGEEQRTVTALEASVYTALIDVRESAPPQATSSHLRFTECTAELLGELPLDADSPLWFDLDGDGDLDLWTGFRLYRQEGGGFQDATEENGVDEAPVATAGDLNADGKTDIVTRDGRYYQSNGDGTFTDLSEQSHLPDLSGATALLFDYDHEGDLDLLFGDADGLHLYRNNRDGTFTEMTEGAGIRSAAEPGSHLYFSDPDGDNDVDFLLARPGLPTEIFLNQRAGKFERAASGPVSTGQLGIGDFDSDGDFDLAALQGRLKIRWNDGKARFANGLDIGAPIRPVRDLRTLDLDNDGALDLLVVWDEGVSIFPGPEFGESRLMDGSFRSVSPADVDLDGDWDLLFVDADGRLVYYRNEGTPNRWIRLTLEGIKNNAQGWMSKVDIKEGSFYLRREIDSEQVLIGVGPRERIDVLRLLWPNGVAQNLIDVTTDQTIHLQEKQGMPSSCPLLFTWNGERFEYVTDLVDAGALGVPLGPEEYLKPDPDEFVKIRETQLQPMDGFYQMRITAELHEVIYLDSLGLWVIDHPEGTVLYPNEAFGNRLDSPHPIQIVRDPQPVVYARDQEDNDLLPVVSAFDGRYTAPFDILPRYQGLATEYELLFGLPKSDAERTVIWLTGWIDWTDGSSNLAASQHSTINVLDPVVEYLRDGRWQMLSPPIGVPAGHNKSVPVALPGDAEAMRITTNLRLYWDQVSVSHDIEERMLPDAELYPLDADLHFRGFSEIVRPTLKSPPLYDYQQVHSASPFVPFQGEFTRYGDVTELLQAPDDRYVIMAPGDEISLRFRAVAPPREGMVRDYLLYTHGWLKDGDLNTAFGTTIEPLPFHAMTNYPYAVGEAYPDDESHLTYRRIYNTRREASVP